MLDQRPGRRPDGLAVVPVQMLEYEMAVVSGRHMFSQRRMAPFVRTAPMGRDPFAFVEDFDRGDGEAHVHGLAHEAMVDSVEMPLDFEMIIEMNARLAPFGILIGSGRQRFEGRLLIREDL